MKDDQGNLASAQVAKTKIVAEKDKKNDSAKNVAEVKIPVAKTTSVKSVSARAKVTKTGKSGDEFAKKTNPRNEFNYSAKKVAKVKVSRGTIATLVIFMLAVVIGGTAFIFYSMGFSNGEKGKTEAVSQALADYKKSLEDPTKTDATQISTADLDNWLNAKSTGFLYIGRPTCHYCQQFNPLLNQAMSELSVAVKYYDTDAASAQDSTTMNAMLTRLNVAGTPTLIYFENGVEVARWQNTYTLESVEDFLKTYAK